MRAQRPFHQQLEGCLGSLELVAAVLHLLDVVQDLQGDRVLAVQVDVELFALARMLARPDKIGDQHPGGVAHQLRPHVLVGFGVALDRARHAPHPCGRRRSCRRMAGACSAPGWPARRRNGRVHAAVSAARRSRSSRPIFSFSAGMMEQRLALPHRSPKPLMVPWTWTIPCSTAMNAELATAHSPVVMGVDAQRSGDRFLTPWR